MAGRKFDKHDNNVRMYRFNSYSCHLKRTQPSDGLTSNHHPLDEASMGAADELLSKDPSPSGLLFPSRSIMMKLLTFNRMKATTSSS